MERFCKDAQASVDLSHLLNQSMGSGFMSTAECECSRVASSTSFDGVAAYPIVNSDPTIVGC
jgi:hypothetical protein